MYLFVFSDDNPGITLSLPVDSWIDSFFFISSNNQNVILIRQIVKKPTFLMLQQRIPQWITKADIFVAIMHDCICVKGVTLHTEKIKQKTSFSHSFYLFKSKSDQGHC